MSANSNNDTSSSSSGNNKSTSATGSQAPKSGVTGGNTSASESSTAIVKQAKDAAVHVAETVKEKVADQITQQTKRSVSEIGSVAKALRHTSEELGDNLASPLVGRAADQIERASDFLQSATLDDIVGSVESFAKREPLLFLGGAFALGMLGARFLKSSAHHQTTSPMKTAAQSQKRGAPGAGSQGRPPAGLSHLASGSVGVAGRS